ncbi:winged helix-turn-helix domain-containing protein [Eubacteriales bacterium OttesenSCG-928-K08]|nr:winged helix-turn-helix domain-containing protein [Eubacteriales bacterium OttesenSCG-928-K08]
MQRKKENLTLFIILPLILVLCYWVWATRVDKSKEVIVYSDTQEWYLHEYDFDDIFVRARGDIAEYVPEALLTPEEFEAADYIVGKPKNAAQYLTSRFRLYVPDGKVYALTTDSVDFADRIYINGTLYQEIGTPATNKEEMVPQTRAQYYTVIPENGVIEIVQQVSNFVHRDGGNPTGFRIGSIETAGRHYDRKLNMASIVMGACLLLFIIHMLLYLMQRNYHANLYFALFCLVWFMQAGAVGQRVFVALYPQLTWYTTFRMEYIATPLSTLFMMLALGSMFPGLVHKPVKLSFIVLCSAVSVFYIFGDTVLMSHAKRYFNYAFTGLHYYMAARFLWLFLRRKERRKEAVIVFSGLIVYGYAMLRDTFYHNDMTFFPKVYANFSDFAVLVFILFQMVAAFYGTMREVAAAKESELAARLEAESLRLDIERKEALHKSIPEEHLVIRGALTLNTLAGKAYLHEEDLQLSQKEFALLCTLMRCEGSVVSREQLYEEVWKQSKEGNAQAIKSAVYRLRKKILGSGYTIVSKRNAGYCFEKE